MHELVHLICCPCHGGLVAAAAAGGLGMGLLCRLRHHLGRIRRWLA